MPRKGMRPASLTALVSAEPANFERVICGDVLWWGADLGHDDAASQVRDVWIIDSNHERGSSGGCLLR